MNILIRSIRHWRSHNAPRMGAALSYYAMLSFVPLILLVVTAAAMLFSKDTVEYALMHQLITTIGPQAAMYISEILHNVPIADVSVTAAVVGASIVLVASIGAFAELDRDIDELWDVPVQRTTHASLTARITHFFRTKIALLSFIPILAVLLMLSMGATVLFSFIQTALPFPSSFAGIATLLQFVAPVVLGTLLFMGMYRIMPNRTLPWRVLFVGAFVTAALFMLGNVLIAQYIKLLVHVDVFGGASSLVGILVWIYYSAQIFFLGASFTYVYADHKGVIASRETVQ